MKIVIAIILQFCLCFTNHKSRSTLIEKKI